MKKQIVATGFVLLSFLFPLKAKAANFDRLYVFGDSLSDTGNLFNLTTAANALDPSIPITPPSPPYYQGRFSNGPVWVDYLAPQLGLTTALIPSTALAVGGSITFTPSGPAINFNYGGATTTNSVDFAFGAAQTGFDSTDPRLPVGLLTEIKSYTDDLNVANQSADPDALYVVWAGANDYESGGVTDPAVPVGNLSNAIQMLAAKGARNFLVPNLPDLGKSPFGLSLGTAESASLTKVTDEHNSALTTVLEGLSDTDKGINIISLDVNSLFKNVIANKETFGFTNVTEPCLTTVSVCANPNQYAFWDSVHPTTAVHKILAEAALERLNSATVPEPPSRVPEPASALGILAFGALGVGLKFKRKLQKASPVKGSVIVPSVLHQFSSTR